MPPHRRLFGLLVTLIWVVQNAMAPRLTFGQGARRANLVKGPYLTALFESGVDVRLELDRASSIVVEVARDRADGGGLRTFVDPTASAMHIVHATGLIPATRYAYVVRAGAKAIGQGRFTTASKPESGAPLNFLVYGDDRTDPTAHAAVVRALAASPSDFLVNTGDMVEDGGRAEDWQSFFDVEAPLLRDRALFVAIGNHELFDDRAGANFARYFGFVSASGPPQPYGTVRLSDVRFFFLSTMHDWGSGEEREWLERELGRADLEPGLVWRIAVVHHGPWSSGPHGACANLVEAHVPELLAGHGVDLILSGHDHIYERGDAGRIKYVVSGGGGAPLYRTSKIGSTRKAESTYHFVEITTSSDAIRLVARRIDGSVLDQCGFRKGERWDCDARAHENDPHNFERSDGSGPRESTDPSPLPPTPGASSRPRCGCAVPGARSASAVSGGLLLAVAIALRRARRRGRAERVDRPGRGPIP
jgi:calcineurin-like phosphoesterase family protein